MKRLGVRVLVLLVMAGCGGGDDGDSTEATPTTRRTTTTEAALSGPTAHEIVAAIQDAGLEASNARDNTESCTFEEQPESSCIALVTTDQVSVYEWPGEDQAAASAPLADCSTPDEPTTGGVRCSAIIGRYTLNIGNDSDFPVESAEPYVAAAEAAINA